MQVLDVGGGDVRREQRLVSARGLLALRLSLCGLGRLALLLGALLRRELALLEADVHPLVVQHASVLLRVLGRNAVAVVHDALVVGPPIELARRPMRLRSRGGTVLSVSDQGQRNREDRKPCEVLAHAQLC